MGSLSFLRNKISSNGIRCGSLRVRMLKAKSWGISSFGALEVAKWRWIKMMDFYSTHGQLLVPEKEQTMLYKTKIRLQHTKKTTCHHFQRFFFNHYVIPPLFIFDPYNHQPHLFWPIELRPSHRLKIRGRSLGFPTKNRFNPLIVVEEDLFLLLMICFCTMVMHSGEWW